jgi:hypothetical protein
MHADKSKFMPGNTTVSQHIYADLGIKKLPFNYTKLLFVNCLRAKQAKTPLSHK